MAPRVGFEKAKIYSHIPVAAYIRKRFLIYAEFLTYKKKKWVQVCIKNGYFKPSAQGFHIQSFH